MKKIVLINFSTDDEKRMAHEFKALLEAERNIPPTSVRLAEKNSICDPTVVFEICNYDCSARRCSAKFSSLRRWQTVPTVLLRPLLYCTGGQADTSFLVSELRIRGTQVQDRVEWLQWLRRASFFACSPAWPVHVADPKYKIAQVQKTICESNEYAFSLSSLADSVDRSAAWLSSRFRLYANINFGQFLIKQKICRALWLLISTDKMVKTISYALNYHDPLYFSKEFKKRLGISPSSIRIKS